MVHIGNLIHTLFENRRIRRAALARHLNIRLESLMKYETKESIQTKRLLEICHQLKHNFFMDIAQTLPADYASNKNIFEEKDQQIAQLQKEVEKLSIERDILLKVKG